MDEWEKIEFKLLIAVITIGGIIAILDFTGMIENINWLKNRIPTITLLLVSLIATSILFGIYSTRKYFKSLLPSGSIKEFENEDNTIEYLLKKIKRARKEICDLCLQKPKKRVLFYSDDEYEKFQKILEETSNRISYKEIIMLRNDATIEKARRMINSTGKYYQLAAYKTLTDDNPNVRGFVIVDEELILLDGLAIKVPSVVKYFRDYYEELWNDAFPIKMGKVIKAEYIDTFESDLKESKI